MPEFKLRKTLMCIEKIHHENGPAPAQPRVRACVVAVASNPFAGRYEADLQSAMDDLKPLGLRMTDMLIDALGGAERIPEIDGYGKAAIAGEGGELEHTALWHVPGGYAMRARLGEAKAIVPSAMKVG
ncbi:MAG: amino acid synthesis family protein, partial [Pseudomonadota bacterium]